MKSCFLDERVCYSHLQAASGTITSPGYPAKYPKNLNCLTRITVTPGKRVYLAFSKFPVQSDNALYFGQCRKARLEVSDAWRFPFRRFCGTILPPVVVSRSNELTLKFHPNNEDALSGYLATYQEVDGEFYHFIISKYIVIQLRKHSYLRVSRIWKVNRDNL